MVITSKERKEVEIEARINIRDAETQWRFAAPDLEEARVQLNEKVDDLIDAVLTTSVYEVKE